MTINATAAILLALYETVARRRGVDPRSAAGHDPERHPQGVHRPRDLHLPAGALDAPGDRHLRLLPGRAARLEHDQHQRLPHARGRGDRGPGGRLHGRQRHRLRRCRRRPPAWPSTSSRRGSRSSSPPTTTSSRRSRSSAPHGACGHGRARPVRRQGSAEHGHALPRPDRRLDPHRAAAGRQRRAHHGPGARGGPGRRPVAAHQRARRGARAADARDRAARAADAAGVVSRVRRGRDRRPAGGLVVRRDPDRRDRPRARWRSSRRSTSSAARSPPWPRLPARRHRRRGLRRAAGSRGGERSSSASTPSPTRARSSDPRRRAIDPELEAAAGRADPRRPRAP